MRKGLPWTFLMVQVSCWIFSALVCRGGGREESSFFLKNILLCIMLESTVFLKHIKRYYPTIFSHAVFPIRNLTSMLSQFLKYLFSLADTALYHLLCAIWLWYMSIWSLGQEDTLEEEMATLSSILSWEILWTEEPGRLYSIGLQRIGHAWATSLFMVLQ